MTIILRINLDIEEKNPLNSLRLVRAASTIKSLAKNGNKLVILSHFGRPKGIKPSFSLRKFVLPLEKRVGRKITFLPHHNFKTIKKAITKAPSHTIFLLENMRFLSGETKNDTSLAKLLAGLGEKYINDDFATSHRINASTSGIIRFIPSRPGPLLLKEVKVLTRIIKNPKKPFVLVIGGAKIADKMGVIKYLLPKVSSVLLGGGPANTFLKAKGVDIGRSIFDKEILLETKKLLRSKKIIIPIDSKGSNNKILDIGSRTARHYVRIIKFAKTVAWGGPLGLFENSKFAGGTKSIWQALLENKKAKIVVGGGETLASFKLVSTNCEPKAKNLFMSTGGGAMLEFLSGKKLPVLVALKLQK